MSRRAAKKQKRLERQRKAQSNWLFDEIYFENSDISSASTRRVFIFKKSEQNSSSSRGLRKY